jgi:signal transduction histidine kinase
MWWDWALLGVVVVAAVAEGVFRTDLTWRAVSMVLAIGLAPTLLWRRTRPAQMVAIAFTISGLAPFLTHGQPTNMATLAFVVLLPYSLLRWGSGRAVVLGMAVLAGHLCLWLLVGFEAPGNAGGEAAVLVTTVALGAAFRSRARARDRELDRAKLLEREHLARDLHDTVAHHVSAMAIRAQAGIAVGQPEAALDALRLIEAEASRALAEMRAMVRVLRRGEPAELAPSPRIADLLTLANRGHVPVVDVEILGDVDDLSLPVGTAIFRLAQESVTNARRHARHATRIEVRVAADDTSVRLRVSDDGDARPLASGSPGYGLVGMAERAGLLGGTCEAGPNPDRGWTVTAVLPRVGSIA